MDFTATTTHFARQRRNYRTRAQACSALLVPSLAHPHDRGSVFKKQNYMVYQYYRIVVFIGGRSFTQSLRRSSKVFFKTPTKQTKLQNSIDIDATTVAAAATTKL